MLDSGLYANLFEVAFEDRQVALMEADLGRLPRLNELRDQIAAHGINARIYAVGERVFGYGPEMERLAQFLFGTETTRISFMPQLASRMILEGYVDTLCAAGYTAQWQFSRATAYQLGKAWLDTPEGVSLFRGFQLQSIYLRNPDTENLSYLISVDAAFTYRDPDGETLSPADVASRFGETALRRIRTRQGDLAPRGGINLEVSRQRLIELILPFVAARSKFSLPCGIPAELSQEPLRVVLVAGEQAA
jgi:hypothetical protein